MHKIWKEALELAEQKGKEAEKNLKTYAIECMNTGRTYSLHGLCGFANVRIRPARGKFVSWLKKQGIGHTSCMGGYVLYVGSDIPDRGQAVDVKEAKASAVASILREHGLNVSVESRLD